MTLGLLGEGADRTRLIDAPFQILQRHPHGFVEAIRIPSLDRSLQHLTYVETVFGQLNGVFVISQLVLVVLRVRVRRWAQDGGTDPNQSQGIADGSEDLLCGGDFSYVPIQNVGPVPQERRLGLACSCCHFRRLGVGRTSRTVVGGLHEARALMCQRSVTDSMNRSIAVLNVRTTASG